MPTRAALLALALSCAACSGAAAPPPQPPTAGLYPRGDDFPCLAYAAGVPEVGLGTDAERHADQRQAKRAGINALGPQYDVEKFVAADARAVGLSTVREVGVYAEEKWNGPHPEFFEKARRTIPEQIAKARAEGPVDYWAFYPEELYAARAVDMDFLDEMTALIRASDPGRAPIFMYEANHRTDAELRRTGQALDLVTMGVYANFAEFREKRAWVGLQVRRMRRVVDDLGGRKGPFPVLEMFNEPPLPKGAPTELYMRHDMARALAEGARGFIIYSWNRRPGFAAHREGYMAGFASLGPSVCGSTPLGRLATRGQLSRLDLRLDGRDLFTEIKWAEERTRIEEVVASRLSLGDEEALILVNSTNAAVSGRVRGLSSALATATPIFTAKGASLANDGAFTLPPLGVIIRIRME
jgi:hypothetical protein